MRVHSQKWVVFSYQEQGACILTPSAQDNITVLAALILRREF